MSEDAINPVDNQPNYGQMFVGKFKVPGIIKEITGADRSWKFDPQKGVQTGGATTVFKGEEIAETITVKCALTTTQHFVDLKAFNAIKPAKGKKPDAMDVRNGVLNDNEITSVELKKFGQKTWEGADGWTITFVWGEHNPSKATQTGAADKSQAANDPQNKTPTAKDEASQIIVDLMKQIKNAA